MKSMHRVVIVGRTNVGKSSIFNLISTDARSIAYDIAGVTRDFIRDEVTWRDRTFELIDTGGISFRKTSDEITEQVRKKALDMVEKSDLLLFVVDVSTALLQEDYEIASLLRKQNKPIIVIANKIDVKGSSEHLYELAKLGFKTCIEISASHNRGLGDVLDAICTTLPATTVKKDQEPQFRVVLLGKPNVGKSSLMNLLLNEERSIVTPIAGTTREPISEKVAFYKEDIVITDTAGVRRKRKVDEPLESLMVRTSFKALDSADIVLLLIDAAQGELADQEWKLAFYAFEQYKALIILYNKEDLVDDEKRKSLKFDNELYAHLLDKVPQLHISCKTGKNVGKILSLVQKTWKNYSQKFRDDELNMVFKEKLLARPLFHKTRPLKLYNVKQIGTAPITLLLFVNEPSWFSDAQLGFFEHVMREKFELKGAPIRFMVRKGE